MDAIKNMFSGSLLPGASHFLILLFSSLFFISCASTSDYNQTESASSSSYTFYDYKDGDKVQYKVFFEDDDISALYIDGKKVSDDEIHKHRNMIYDKLDNINHGSVHKSKRDMHIDMNWLNDMMSDLKENLKQNEIRIHFDKEEFKDEMARLKEELDNLEIDINFDEENFKREMKGLKKHLRKMRPEKFNLDMEEFNERMKEFSEKMKDHKIVMKNFKVNIPPINIPDVKIPDIPPIPDIKVDLSGLEESMKDLDKNMAELDKEMKKLDAFMNDFKKELVKDGIISNEEESFELNYHKDGLEINGERVPDHLYEKYKKLYKEHFGKEFDPHLRIKIND